MYFTQAHIKNIDKYLIPGNVLVVYGARRVGKTTLVEQYLKRVKEKYLFVNGEDINVQKYLSSQSIEKLKEFIGENKLFIIDEAQSITNIGLNLKLIVDNIPDLKVIATGSSSFDIDLDIGEPLTGRRYVLKMFPLAQMELSNYENPAETLANLESRLIYGSYPEVISSYDKQMKQRYLQELVQSYLLKDILQLNGVRKADKLIRLLQLLAFQIGKEVSVTELGKQLSLGKNTVDRYLDLLEKVFVITKLSGFSRNLRKEISKNNRYYFVDLGIRNSLINNFNILDIRNDIGQLWENYIVIERMKKREYTGILSNNYFWRTYDKKEIDLVEEYKGKLTGYEIKWKKENLKSIPTWLDTYPNSSLKLINHSNYLTFIT